MRDTKKAVQNSSLEDVTGSPLVPDPVKYAFRHAGAVRSEEELLWRLTAARAILDCVGVTGYGPSAQRKHLSAVVDAQKWFRDSWDDVREVFDYAGIPVDGIREIMCEYHIDEQNRVIRIPVIKREVEREVHQVERSRAGAC